MIKERHHLAEVIGEKTLSIKDFDELRNEVAAYLLVENSVNDLDSLMRDVMKYRATKGFVEAVAISANKLSETDMDDIKKILHSEYPEAKTVIVKSKIDPSIIGGVQLNMPGEQLDLSIRHKLNLFKELTSPERNLA
jgi:F0F1-type ATP synthase delta subunit